MEGYVGWKEVLVCGEKGKREIHFCLKRKDGGSNLVVVGKDKSLRHMSYKVLPHFATPSFVKFKSKREVIEFLNSFIPDSLALVSPQTSASIDGMEADDLDAEMKVTQLGKLFNHTKGFQWSSSSWTCKRQRKHYQSFCCNGIKVSVNEFVFVLAEENKRLVAYLDDMYEDAKGNKKVVVRWLHKIDEVGIDLPRVFEDREVFFSLCFQDLSIECVDGLTTVLSPQHYAKFLKEMKHSQAETFVCRWQYDDEDLKPFDISQVKGYWKQEIIRKMFYFSSLRASEKLCLPISSQNMRNQYLRNLGGVSCAKPRKRTCLSGGCKVDVQCATVNNVIDTDCDMNVKHDMNVQHDIVLLDHQRKNVVKCRVKQGAVAAVSRKGADMGFPQCSVVGSLVEVLSQDSGMRGCWFKAAVIKKHKNKVKLRYHDIKDADNEANFLEEWVSSSRIAVCDEMGFRLHGRTTIRPVLLGNDGKVSGVINVGTSVDVWWHDGWWEGIVIQKEPNEKFRVYFPGEKRQSIFCRSDLRRSQEWIRSTWNELVEMPDLAASVLADLVKEGTIPETNVKPPQTVVNDDKQIEHDVANKSSTHFAQDCSRNLHSGSADVEPRNSTVLDLLKDDFLSRLKWSCSRKRKRNVFLDQKLRSHGWDGMNSGRIRRRFHAPLTLEIDDQENCKYMSDSVFGTSGVSALSNMVMSR